MAVAQSLERRSKLGLSLAGGGFRASLFHLGVLRRMAELDLLRRVEVLSTVSGGSIIGALYILLLRQRINTRARLERADYVSIVDELEKTLVAAIQRNLRTRLVMNPLGLLNVLLTNDTLGARMGRLYERYIYADFVDPAPDTPWWKSILWPGRMSLREVMFKPDGQPWKGGFEDYNRKASETGGSAATSLVLNATSLNSGAQFWFSSVDIGDGRLGACRFDELESEVLPRKQLLHRPTLDELDAALDRDSSPCVEVRGVPYPRDAVLWARWWRAPQEGRPPRAVSPVFDGGIPPDSLRLAEFGCLRQAKLSAWYLRKGPALGVSAAIPDAAIIDRFWEAIRNIDDALATRLADRVGSDPMLFAGLLDAMFELYLLRAAVAVAPTILRDWRAIRLGDAVAASACFPPVFPPYMLLGFYDDLVVTRLGLTDGGVYDNLGITTLLEEGCNYVIASDTGGLFDVDQRISTGRVGMGGRIISILMDDVAGQQRTGLRRRRRVTRAVDEAGVTSGKLDELMASYALDGLVYFHIDSPPTTTPGLDVGLRTHDLANLRTDLDAFGDVEVAALANHGYAVADRYIRQHLGSSPLAQGAHWSAATAFPIGLPVDERTRAIVRTGKSRFLRSVLLWDPFSTAFTALIVGLFAWLTWRMRISTALTEGAEWVRGVAREWAVVRYGGLGIELLDARGIGLGRAVVGGALVLLVARWAWPALVPRLGSRAPRGTRRFLGLLKRTRGYVGNLTWFLGGAPIWITLIAAGFGWLSHLVYAKPFLGATLIPGSPRAERAIIRLTRTVGALGVLVVGIALAVLVYATPPPRADLPDHLHRPVLAMELVRSTDAIAGIVGAPGSDDRRLLRDNTLLDFAFIVAYWSLLIAMSTLLGRSYRGRWMWVLALAAAATSEAAVADLSENVGILAVLDGQPADTTTAMVLAIRHAALVKWGLFFSVLGVLGAFLLGRRWWLAALGALFLASAVTGLVGLAYHPAIEWATTIMVGPLLVVAVVFAALPSRVARALLSPTWASLGPS